MYNGFCRLGIKWQPIESEHMRSYFQLSSDQTGVLVTKVLPLFSCSNVVKRGDVLMAVDEEVIADNGTVRISDVSILGFHMTSPKFKLRNCRFF